MPITPLQVESSHYMVLPAPQFWNSTSALNFQISFSGEAIVDFKGNVDGSWRNDRLEIGSNVMRMDKIMERVIGALPTIQPNDHYEFLPLQWTVYASVNSQFNAGNSVNAGYGAYNFGIIKDKYLEGMFVDIQVRDNDARIHRVAYSMNVYGFFEVIPGIS